MGRCITSIYGHAALFFPSTETRAVPRSRPLQSPFLSHNFETPHGAVRRVGNRITRSSDPGKQFAARAGGEGEMEKASGSGSKPATRFGFGFSWADEVEREEQEQEHLAVVEKPGPQAKKEEKTTRADPFGAARPREVVLAEKGVDWRARDREIDAAAVTASICGRTAPPPARATMAMPARRAIWDRGSVRTPDAPPASRSPWGSGKRMCARKVPAPARPAPVAGDQGTRVLSEINRGEGCVSLFQGAAKKSFNLRGIKKEGNKANEAAVVDGGCSAMAASATVTEDQSTTIGRKRKGRKRGRKGGSKKTENQQPLLI